MVAAIFLASKVEDRKISSRVLSEHVASLNKEVSVEEIISHELVLMEVRARQFVYVYVSRSY